MANTRPNIIVILVDDMGFSDIGCFGAEIATPNLDALAAQGVRQTQFYNCARCCPTRASLQTGCHPHRAGIGHMVNDNGHPSYRGFLREDLPTVAERLRAVGYCTWMSGKWHVGGEYPVHQSEKWSMAGDPGHPIPTQRGFDRYYGTLCGAGSYFTPQTLFDQDHFVDLRTLPKGYYYTDELGVRAAGFVDEAVDAGKPFLGYLTFTAPHWPLHAPEADIAAYRGKYREGWDVLRQRRLRSLVDQGLLPADQALSQRDEKSKPWEEAQDQAWEDERMAVYAAQITAMDRAVGILVDRLKDRGVFEDTLIVFCSDNGGCAEFLREDGKRGVWPEFYGGPQPDGYDCKVGNTPGVAPGSNNTFMSYDLPWSNASNTPFRKFKSWTHEGGISSPLIACWPKGLPAGVIRHSQGHIIDFGATACALAGADGSGMDGVDLTPAWRDGGEVERSEPLCWEHQGHSAVRDGTWKVVRASNAQPWELYDIGADRIEETDLAAKHPEIVARLNAIYEAWAERCGVLPFPLAKQGARG